MVGLGSSEPSTVTTKWAAGTPVTFAYPLSFGTLESMVFLYFGDMDAFLGGYELGAHFTPVVGVKKKTVKFPCILRS